MFKRKIEPKPNPGKTPGSKNYNKAMLFKYVKEKAPSNPEEWDEMWKKHYKVDGQVTQHLSPFEQHIVTSFLKEMPSKFLTRAKEFLFEAGPGLAVGVAVYYWGDWKHKDIAFHHRS